MASEAREATKKSPSARPRRLLLVFLGSFLSFLAIYLALYRWIDPRDQFGTGVFPAPITNARRAKQETLIRYAAQGPLDALILGSSRTMMIDPSQSAATRDLRIFNFGVENAMIEDDLAIYRWAHNQAINPKLLIVGVDVEAFDPANRIDDRLQSNTRLLETISPSAKDALSPQSLRSYATVTSNALTVQSSIAMIRAVEFKIKPGPQTEIVREDGHADFPLSDGVKNYDLQSAIGATLPVYTAKYQGMKGLSAQRKQWLVDLIEMAQRERCRLLLWITPLHPKMAKILDESTYYGERLKDTKDFLAQLTKKYPNTRAFDYSLPENFGGNDTDWIDGAHMNKTNAARALDAMLAPGAHGL